MDERDKTRIRAEAEIDQSAQAVHDFVDWFNDNMESFLTLHEALSVDPTLPITLSGEERQTALTMMKLLGHLAMIRWNTNTIREIEGE